MVLMALDHVRVFAAVPAGGPTAGVFLTRWVTHFCAPAFFFLAGTSAFLRGAGPATGPSQAHWLATRGVWLLVLEMTFVRWGWTFNFDYAHYLLAGVIWALGWCMIGMAALSRLPLVAVTLIGLVLVAGHDAVQGLLGEPTALLDGPLGPLLRVLYFGGALSLGAPEPNFFVLYSIVPWLGVMALGYAFGAVMGGDSATRRNWCGRAGLFAVGLFLLLRATQAYGDRPWAPAAGEEPWAPAWIMFLSTTKYPASLQFLLMTLGPTLLALAALDGARGPLARWLAVFGRVPMFYYLLHIPLIHLLAMGIAALRSPQAMGWLFANHPLLPPTAPDGYRWPLVLLYSTTLVAVVALYPLCRWYDRVKAERRWSWTTYL